MATKTIFDRVRLCGLAHKAPDAELDSKSLSIPEGVEERFLELEKLFSEKAAAGSVDAGNADLVVAAYDLAAEAAVATVCMQSSDLELAEALIESSRAFRRRQLEALIDVTDPALDCTETNEKEVERRVKRRSRKTGVAVASL